MDAHSHYTEQLKLQQDIEEAIRLASSVWTADQKSLICWATGVSPDKFVPIQENDHAI